MPEEEHAEEADAGGSGIPIWGLVLGVIAGVVIGGAGARFIGPRA
jgi:hypothetical protein